MNAAAPLTVYYDASCPLCRAEIAALKSRDRDGKLLLIDCSAPDFDDIHAASAGLSHCDLMRAIHARDANGRWLSDVDVFAAMYRIAGFRVMARLWAHPWLRPLWKRGYPWVARNRMQLSRLGFTRLFARLARR